MLCAPMVGRYPSAVYEFLLPYLISVSFVTFETRFRPVRLPSLCTPTGIAEEITPQVVRGNRTGCATGNNLQNPSSFRK